MRSFERYLYRRTIEDPEAYFQAKGITTNERLEEWCENHGMTKPSVPVFLEPEPAPKQPAPKTKKPAAPKKGAEGASKSWHVPAAERPLKKPTAKQKPAVKKKKATK